MTNIIQLQFRPFSNDLEKTSFIVFENEKKKKTLGEYLKEINVPDELIDQLKNSELISHNYKYGNTNRYDLNTQLKDFKLPYKFLMPKDKENGYLGMIKNIFKKKHRAEIVHIFKK